MAFCVEAPAASHPRKSEIQVAMRILQAILGSNFREALMTLAGQTCLDRHQRTLDPVCEPQMPGRTGLAHLTTRGAVATCLDAAAGSRPCGHLGLGTRPLRSRRGSPRRGRGTVVH